VLDPSFLQDVNVNVLPRADNTYDIGSSSLRWRRLFLGDYAVARSLLGSGRRFALNFDGVDDYVRVPHSDALNIATGNRITIEVRAYLTGWQPGHHVGILVDKRTENQANYNWEYNANLMMYRVHAAGAVWAVSVPHSLNTWNHYVMTLDGPVLRGYINGELKAERADVPEAGMNTVDLFIGQTVFGSFRIVGFISEVRIYNRPLTPDEVLWNYLHPDDPVRDGLVLWLRMDEGYGDTVYDLSGLGNNGTIYGATWSHTETPVGLGAEREVLTSKYIVGRLGVGTAAPAERLHVAGNIRSYSVLPDADNTYDLGSPTLRWRDVYAMVVKGALISLD